MSKKKDTLVVAITALMLLPGIHFPSTSNAGAPDRIDMVNPGIDSVREDLHAAGMDSGPYIVSANPSHLETDVALFAGMSVEFSTTMRTTQMAFSFKEYDGSSWINATLMPTISWPSLSTLSIDHRVDFMPCRPYKLRIWAVDITGRPLTESPMTPNPFRFQTRGDTSEGCAPFMAASSPYSEQLNVSPSQNLTITWHYDPDAPSGGINASSFAFKVTNTSMGDITGNFTAQWSGPGSSTVNLNHPTLPFDVCGMYSVKILSLKDVDNRSFIPGMIENPLRFRTDDPSCPPYVLETSPHDEEWGVEFNRDVAIKFTKPMNTSIDFLLIPLIDPLSFTWSENDTFVRISHAKMFNCGRYSADVFGTDKEGNGLTWAFVPPSWSFVTLGPCSIWISDVSPVNDQREVPLDKPIFVSFSDPAERASLEIWLTPYNGRFSVAWFDDSDVQIDHTMTYAKCTEYTVTIDVISKNEDPLLGGPYPNPWHFHTICDPFYIVYTDPPDGAIDVPLGHPITIGFSEPFILPSFTFTIVPFQGPFTVTFPNNQTAMVNASLSSPCTLYYVTVNARSLDGDLMPFPNMFHFTTVCTQPPEGLQVHRLPPDDVMLTWVPITDSPYYTVFHSSDKLAAWPWPVVARVYSNSVTIRGHLSDGFDHYYIVRAHGATGMNSTMGAVWKMRVAQTPGKYNGVWFSLPYHTIYGRASDIADELGCSKVNLIGKWDEDAQKLVFYYCLQNQWRGPDFKIDTGDGLLLSVVSTFEWAINGTDTTIMMSFTFKPVLQTHFYFIGIPYTSPFDTASQLVANIAGGLGPGTNTKIAAVGKWNNETEQYEIFRYTPTGWSGVDFELGTGECVWIEIVASFDWTSTLITPEVR